MERPCPGRSMGRLVLVFVPWGTLVCVLVPAAILFLYLIACSASPPLSLFSCTVTNICPKLLQSPHHSSPRVNYALSNVGSTAASSWKLIWSFRIFAPKYYKCPSWKFLSYLYLPPEPLFHQGFLFSFRNTFCVCGFLSLSSFKQIQGFESSLWH